MRVGMLWFDNDPNRDLPAKIQRAVDYYRRKYGRLPSVCYLHPSMLLGQTPMQSGVLLRESNMMLLNHFWLGVEEEAAVEVSAA